jgi:hypothetical protein
MKPPGIVAVGETRLVAAHLASTVLSVRVDVLPIAEITGFSSAFTEGGMTARHLSSGFGGTAAMARLLTEDQAVVVHSLQGDLVLGFGTHTTVAASFYNFLNHALLAAEPEPPPTGTGADLADQLERLHGLHRGGALSLEEFQAAKHRLLFPE